MATAEVALAPAVDVDESQLNYSASPLTRVPNDDPVLVAFALYPDLFLDGKPLSEFRQSDGSYALPSLWVTQLRQFLVTHEEQQTKDMNKKIGPKRGGAGSGGGGFSSDDARRKAEREAAAAAASPSTDVVLVKKSGPKKRRAAVKKEGPGDDDDDDESEGEEFWLELDAIPPARRQAVRDMFDGFPMELIVMILSHTSAKDTKNVAAVSRRFHAASWYPARILAVFAKPETPLSTTLRFATVLRQQRSAHERESAGLALSQAVIDQRELDTRMAEALTLSQLRRMLNVHTKLDDDSVGRAFDFATRVRGNPTLFAGQLGVDLFACVRSVRERLKTIDTVETYLATLEAARGDYDQLLALANRSTATADRAWGLAAEVAQKNLSLLVSLRPLFDAYARQLPLVVAVGERLGLSLKVDWREGNYALLAQLVRAGHVTSAELYELFVAARRAFEWSISEHALYMARVITADGEKGLATAKAFLLYVLEELRGGNYRLAFEEVAAWDPALASQVVDEFIETTRRRYYGSVEVEVERIIYVLVFLGAHEKLIAVLPNAHTFLKYIFDHVDSGFASWGANGALRYNSFVNALRVVLVEHFRVPFQYALVCLANVGEGTSNDRLFNDSIRVQGDLGTLVRLLNDAYRPASDAPFRGDGALQAVGQLSSAATLMENVVLLLYQHGAYTFLDELLRNGLASVEAALPLAPVKQELLRIVINDRNESALIALVECFFTGEDYSMVDESITAVLDAPNAEDFRFVDLLVRYAQRGAAAQRAGRTSTSKNIRNKLLYHLQESHLVHPNLPLFWRHCWRTRHLTMSPVEMSKLPEIRLDGEDDWCTHAIVERSALSGNNPKGTPNVGVATRKRFLDNMVAMISNGLTGAGDTMFAAHAIQALSKAPFMYDGIVHGRRLVYLLNIRLVAQSTANYNEAENGPRLPLTSAVNLAAVLAGFRAGNKPDPSVERQLERTEDSVLDEWQGLRALLR